MYLKTTAEQKADLHVREELQPGYCLYSVYYEVFMISSASHAHVLFVLLLKAS